MKIYNALWIDGEFPFVQSFYKFEDALASVDSDIKKYEKHYGFMLETSRQEEDSYFARMEDVFEVEIVGTVVR